MRVNSIGALGVLNSITALNNQRKVQSNPILPFDSVSFTSKYVNKPINVDFETAKFVANSLAIIQILWCAFVFLQQNLHKTF